MESFWFWSLILLADRHHLRPADLALHRERWPYQRGGGWTYAPSGLAFALALILVILFWLGIISIWWPWGYVAA